MNLIFMTVLSMSLSGALLISLLLLGGRLMKGRVSRQWQYYIWLIVVMRFLLPFGPDASLMEHLYQTADRMIVQRTWKAPQAEQSLEEKSPHSSVEKDEDSDAENREELLDDAGQTAIKADNTDFVLKSGSSLVEEMELVKNYLWVMWLTVAFGMLIRKITVYQSYIKYVAAGAERVCEISLLDRLAVITEQAGISRSVELCVNPRVSSPMLVGYFHPCIVLPDLAIAETDFHYIVMHELTHYKRHDILYKWLVQVTVCLHWFNPLVYVMSREIDRACEFSCDEAVVAKMGYDHAKNYGETLLNAMAVVGTFKEPSAAVTLSTDKRLLKERLDAIMRCERKTKRVSVITAGLTVGIVLGTFFLGVCPTTAAEPESSKTTALSTPANASETDAERFYQAGSLPMFYIAFADMDEKEQRTWIDRFYADGEIDFFSVSVWTLDADSPLIQFFAEKFYEDGDIAFFSVLADQMEEDTLERWLDQALADQKWNFQSMLYDRLDREEEKDALEKAMDEQQMEAYRAVGVTWNGKNCYYKGQLVHIFLDIHMPNRSFYTLDMNPAGTVNIKIIRSADGEITGVAYMSEAEVEELFGESFGDTQEETEEFPREMVVTKPVCNIREGAGEEFKVVCMLEEGDIVNVLGKKEDSVGRMWYLLVKESLTEQPNASVKTGYIRADLLRAD